MALDIRLAMYGEMHPDVAESYGNIGLVYFEQGDMRKAQEYYKTAIKIDEKTLGPQHPYTLEDKEMLKTIKAGLR